MNKLWIPLAVLVPAILFIVLRKRSGESLEVSEASPKTGKHATERNLNPARTAAKSKGDVKKSVSMRCKASTASGKKCSRVPLPGSDFCWQHTS